MNDLLSPKQVGRALGLSESSIKRYCDQGAINFVRTLGGHRKLPLSDVLQFVKDRDQAIVLPGALGLPTRSPRSAIGLEKGVESLVDALLQGNEDDVRQIVFDLYLARHSISTLCDRLICPAFREIGTRWACSAVDVYQERRSCELIRFILHSLRTTLKSPEQEWTACGGTLEGDHYTLPNTMIELVLRDSLWNAISLGTAVPCQSLANALTDLKPKLFWLSISHICDVDRLVDQIAYLSNWAASMNTVFVIGGRAINDQVRLKLSSYSCLICDSMQQLETLARSIRRVGTTGPGLEAST